MNARRLITGLTLLLLLPVTLSARVEYTDDGEPTGGEEALRWILNRARFLPARENERQQSSYSVPTTSLPPLAPHEDLLRASRNHSEDLANTDAFQHETPEGSTHYDAGSHPWDRALAEGYDWGYFGENIGAGFLTPGEVFAGWFHSEGHRVNMLDGEFREVGHGYAYRGQTVYEHYYTQDLGTLWNSDSCFFTGTFFRDIDEDGVYDSGEGIGGIEVQVSTAQGVLDVYDRSTPSGNVAVPIDSIPAGSTVEILVENRSGQEQELSIPRDADTLVTLTLADNELVTYGAFVKTSTPQNVGFRDLAPGPLSTPTVRFAVSFPDRWVAVKVYDAEAQEWVMDENRYNPTDVEIQNIVPGRWYLIGLWDFSENAWVFQEWFCRM